MFARKAFIHTEHPPVHPIAYHSAYTQESLRIGTILASAFSELKAAYKEWNQRRIDRAAFQHMIDLDDAILRDIGVTRADIGYVNSLPLSVNASAELEIISRQNRKRR